MSFRWFIYYCTAYGGCAGYLGWLLGRSISFQYHLTQASFRGFFLGFMVAAILTLVDTFWHSRRGVASTAMIRVGIAGLVGGVGGALGGLIGQALYASTLLSLFLVLGWSFTGLLIGMAPGSYDVLMRFAADEDSTFLRRKLFHGILGGIVGGLIGGLLFLLMRGFWNLVLTGQSDAFWSPGALGFVILGMCIGLFIGLVQVILKTAWITVVSGFRSGRELLLTPGVMILGRAESCDIPLFGDPGADLEHARIRHESGHYWLEDLQSRTGTYLNGKKVTAPVILQSGDLIEIGRSQLRFGERIREVAPVQVA